MVSSFIPYPAINLETWIPPYYRQSSFTHVLDCGSIAPFGKLGWFIQSSLMNAFDSLDSWKMFRNPAVMKIFAFEEKDEAFLAAYTQDKDSRFFCSSPRCESGIFTPNICKNEECAMLLTSTWEETSFLISDIESLGLYARVAWVGPNLRDVVQIMVKKYERMYPPKKSVVVVAWTPSDIIPDLRNFSAVSFPSCNFEEDSIGCKYEVQRLAKLAWPQLQKSAKPVYEALKLFDLGSQGYRDILNFYFVAEDQKNFSKIACDWMKVNDNTWNKWIPNDYAKSEIFIGGIFPLTSGPYNGNGIYEAASMAIEAINRNESLLTDYTLRIIIQDGKCQPDNVMRAFIEYMRFETYNSLIGILGPACSETFEPLAGVSVHYHTVVVSYSAEGSSFSNRVKYPYVFRTVGENKQYKYIYLKLLQQLEWKKVAALTEDGQKYTEYLSNLHDSLTENGINFVANRKFPSDRHPNAMKQYLQDLKKKNARIIIADVDKKAAREVMCEAYHLQMTAEEGYVWFLPLWHEKNWFETDHHNTNDENVTCSTQEMIQAINGYFSLTPQFFGPKDQMMQEGKNISEWLKEYKAALLKNDRKESNYAGFAYDAVWMYALAVDKLIRQDTFLFANLHSHETTEKFVKILNATDFHGVSGHINFKSGPSRPAVINVMQWMYNKTTTIGTYYQSSTSNTEGGDFHLDPSKIVWLTSDGLKPKDGSEISPCSILGGVAEFFDIECNTAILIVNIFVISTSALILLMIVLVIRHSYAKKMKLAEKYMKTLGIDILSPDSLSNLDKWEIPRENIVINRKLGEGAFGTVYGGEALLHNEWTAVAVKTLKTGSTREEKLDFLSEAEVMKRFDHINIIKLLGVCTKNEPVYNVMEFMLYGDLKTYLLARRHLVSEQSKTGEESEEISSKRLTQIALDVAKALTYLAEHKYVHRDVASRNCLINAQRTTKLGDYGMTRPMFENEYYKFSRKGMLPVRWMAPESLILGIFTPESDVWSFGVLLYEVITFGNFPFQGLSNSQVLEHIKEGNTLVIPSEAQADVKDLIKSCWNLEQKKRPKASTLVEALTNNPQLLSPCLDTPISSVQIENSRPLDFDFPEKVRKCSLALKSPVKHGCSQPNTPIWPINQVPQDLLQSNHWLNDTHNSNANRIWSRESLDQEVTASASDPLLFEVGSNPMKYLELVRRKPVNTDYCNYNLKEESDSVL